MGIRVDKLIQDVRRDSGLRDNPLFSDDQIAEIITDAKASLVDRFIEASAANWLCKKFRFTLAGGNDGCAIDMAELPDFERDIWLNRSPENTPPETIDKLESQTQRNFGSLPISRSGRRYDVIGDRLVLYPASRSAGEYELAYMPMSTPIALPSTPPTRSVSLNTGDVHAPSGRWTFPAGAALTDSDRDCSFLVSGAANAGNNGTKQSIAARPLGLELSTANTGLVTETFGAGDAALIQQSEYSSRSVEASSFDTYNVAGEWAITNGNFSASDVGAVIRPSLNNENRHLNIEFEIAVVLSSTFVVVNSLRRPTDGQASPVSGSYVIDRRQLGATYELEDKFTPWAKWITAAASITIRIGRQQDTADLDRTLARETGRVMSMAKTRSKGVIQAPLMKRRLSGIGLGYRG